MGESWLDCSWVDLSNSLDTEVCGVKVPVLLLLSSEAHKLVIKSTKLKRSITFLI